MSILIKGMEMPLSCGYCPLKQFTLHTGDDCLVGAKETEYQKRPADCPIVELPAQHGKLIDGDVAEVITYTNESGDFADGILYAADWIAAQPTIIEADKEGEG